MHSISLTTKLLPTMPHQPPLATSPHDVLDGHPSCLALTSTPHQGGNGVDKTCPASHQPLNGYPTPTHDPTPTAFWMVTPTASPSLPPPIKGETGLTRHAQHLVNHRMATHPHQPPLASPPPWHSGWPLQPPCPCFPFPPREN